MLGQNQRHHRPQRRGQQRVRQTQRDHRHVWVPPAERQHPVASHGAHYAQENAEHVAAHFVDDEAEEWRGHSGHHVDYPVHRVGRVGGHGILALEEDPAPKYSQLQL